jgi:hypothetical protein
MSRDAERTTSKVGVLTSRRLTRCRAAFIALECGVGGLGAASAPRVSPVDIPALIAPIWVGGPFLGDPADLLLGCARDGRPTLLPWHFGACPADLGLAPPSLAPELRNAG